MFLKDAKVRIHRTTQFFSSNTSLNLSSSSESNPLLDRTLTKINAFVKHLDSSILTAEICYEFTSAAMIACDKENTEWVGTTIEDLSSLASKGSEIAQGVAAGFKEVEQAVYKVSQKCSTAFVSSPNIYRLPRLRKIAGSLFKFLQTLHRVRHFTFPLIRMNSNLWRHE
jgi:hypothetical protein